MRTTREAWGNRQKRVEMAEGRFDDGLTLIDVWDEDNDSIVPFLDGFTFQANWGGCAFDVAKQKKKKLKSEKTFTSLYFWYRDII